MAEMTAGSPLAAGSADYPAQLSLDAPLEVARWRPLVHWLLAIPHVFVLALLRWAAGIAMIVAFFAILFTEKFPEGIFNFRTMVYRYQWRVGSYALFLRESYPPFEFEMTARDPGGDPAKLSVEYPQELNRWLPLVKWLLGFPHLLVLMVLAIGVFGVWFASFFVVLFTGKHSEGMRRYLLDVSRYQLRVQAYIGLLRDEYPPFALH